jgi:hypothetical protein
VRRSLCCCAFATLVLVAASARADATLGGWAGMQVSVDSKAGSKPGLDVHPWYFNMQADPMEDLHFFGELEVEHLFQFAAGEVGAGEFFVERLYVEKEFSTAHHVRLGKTFTPFGYWYWLHWGILTETVSKPITVDNEYVPDTQVGAQYWGRSFRGNTEFTYFAWITDGPDLYATDLRTVVEPGLGASVFVNHQFGGREDLTLGVTAGTHVQWVDTGTRIVRQDNAVGGVEAKLVRVDLRGEFYWHHTSAGGLRNTLYCTAVGWVLPTLGVVYRFDWGDDEKHTVAGTSERAWSHTLGLLWRPNGVFVAKLEGRFSQFQSTLLPAFWQGTAALAVKY